MAALVTELLGTSPRFARMWAAHDVQVRRRITKRVDLVTFGPLEYECEILHLPDMGQRLIVYTAEPGSPTWEAVRRLSTVGQPAGSDATGAMTAYPETTSG